jgi:hypothetical protein
MDDQGMTDRSVGKAEGRSITVTVVELVAAETERDPLELPPLATVVEPEALDRLFTDDTSTEASVQFQFAGCHVSVTASGVVTVERS